MELYEQIRQEYEHGAGTIRAEIRHWNLHLRSDKSIEDLSRMFNPIIRGWLQYYGRFYRSALYPPMRQLDRSLARWADRKYKKLRRHLRRATHWVARISRRDPKLWAHWQMGVRRGSTKVRERWRGNQSRTSEELRDRWASYARGWWGYFRLAEMRSRMLKVAFSSRGAWRLAGSGSLHTALSNAVLRRYGFLMPSGLAVL